MRNSIIKYIEEEVSKLKNNGDCVRLKDVCPYLLEYVLGDFDDPYELNGYDCDYWARVGDYSISGSMRYGTAKITFSKKDM